MNCVEYREKLAREIRKLRPRTVIIPYWEARHPDHYHAGAIAFDASFLAGLRKLDPESEPVYRGHEYRSPKTLRVLLD